jgi:2-oxo-4-hydroxy-4-carboxy-5-ureidoimidazoline decarboxylase
VISAVEVVSTAGVVSAVGGESARWSSAVEGDRRRWVGMMSVMTAPGLQAFNALDAAAARRALLECCASMAWATRVAAGRPYPDAASLFAAADAAVHDLDPTGLTEALAGHPRIGERPAGPAHRASRREQAGVAGADRGVLDAIAAGNAAYEQRFGHVYLVCATGRSAPELLDILQSRLANDPATEDRVTRTELAKINRIRLDRMLNDA